MLVLAVRTLPPKADALEPWDLHALVPYDDQYLSGFVAESYKVDLPEGFERRQADHGPDDRRDDPPRHRRRPPADRRPTAAYHDITFKHLLLPMWISAYRYQDKVFTFLVNARTGEVQGERPYSAWKIALLVLAILIVVATVALLLPAVTTRGEGN